MKKFLKPLAVLTTLAMFTILIGGALVTSTGSGLGCGRSWPFCQGEIIPDNITPELIIEMAHRLSTFFGSFFVLGLAFFSWRTYRGNREVTFLAVTSVIFLFVQAFLGAGAVLWGQNDFIMALHFGISLISFASVFLLTLLIFEFDQKWGTDKLVLSKRMRAEILWLFAFLFVAIYSGALVRHTDALLANLNFPFSGNGFQMPSTLQEWVQTLHRVAAAVLSIWIFKLMVQYWRSYSQFTVLCWAWTVAFILVLCQAVTGVLNVMTRIDLYLTLAHSFFITALFGLICYIVLLALRGKKIGKRY